MAPDFEDPIGFTRESTHQVKVRELAERLLSLHINQHYNWRRDLELLSKLAQREYEKVMPWQEGFPYRVLFADAWWLKQSLLQSQRRIDAGAEVAEILDAAP